MKSSMRKTTRREIRASFGRYFAILAIVALGVGFFVGLMVTTPAMVKTGGDYMNRLELYDMRLVSTLGFEKDAPELFAGKEGIEAAEGAVSADFLATEPDGRDRVLAAQTLLETQNRLELVAGRLPEAPDEVVADASLYPESAVGSTIRISEENPEATAELFAYKEYKIVGTAHAVYYVNYERGATTLGNGRVGGFVYLLPEGFDTDYYTEVFLRLDEDYEIYSDEYKAAAQELELWAEPLAEQAAQERYDRIISDAKAEIDDAKKTLREETAEAKAELAEAEQELSDGQAELEDGRAALADGRGQIADAKAELSSRQAELDRSRQELSDGRAELEAGLLQIAEGKAQLQAAIAAAQGGGSLPGEGMQGSGSLPGSGQTQASDLQAQLNALEAQLAALEAQEAELLQKQAELEAGEAQLAAGQEQLDGARRTLSAKEKELEEQEGKLADAEKELADGQQEYEDGRRTLAEETADAKGKIADAEEELAKIEAPDVYALGRDTNMGYACYENDSAIVAGIAKVFPFFFFLVAALVCITTMNRMVEEQRTQIGVLKALGYSEARIMGKYLYYAGSAGVIGSVIGFVIGSTVFPTVIWSAYRIMYNLGDYTLYLDWRLAAVSLAAAMLCSMGATWLTCRYELSGTAAELIRPKSPKSGKRIVLERMPFLWNRLSFLAKVSVRNVFRYKQRFFMMVVGIGGCTALLVTGFGVKDTIADVADMQYEEVQLYDMGVTLKDSAEEGMDGALAQALEESSAAWTAAAEVSMDLTGKDATKSAIVVVPQDMGEIGKYVDLHTHEGEAVLWPQKGEAVINEKLAQNCGIRVGDMVSLRNEDGEKLWVTVSALSQNFIYNYVYVSPETWEENNGSAPRYRTLYLQTAEGTDSRVLSETLLACDGVSAVSVNADLLNQVNNMMKSLDAVILLIIVCAGALAFIVIYNLTNINITERIREIATIKVLGFFPKETAAYVYRENVVLTAAGALAGLFAGVWLHRFVMANINIDMIAFDVRILPMSFVNSVLLTFVFMLIVDVIMYVKLEKINMAESLKSVE